MFCNKCGSEVNSNQKYCSKCGSELVYNSKNNMYEPQDYRNSEEYDAQSYQDNNQYNVQNYQENSEIYENKEKKSYFIPAVTVGCGIIIVLMVAIFIVIMSNSKVDFYFDDKTVAVDKTTSANQPPMSNTTTNGKNDQSSSTGSSTNNSNNNTATSTTSTSKGKYKTSIITDNKYEGINIRNVDDAYKLIREDSENQKQADYPKDIIQIENDIIKRYSITAVNLKEMEADFARELEKVLDNIYKEYPKARGYLTNITLTNLDITQSSVIALFRPVFIFGTSDTETSLPWVIKTQIELNSKYFLNKERITATIEDNSKAGHFPPNATIYSPVAHEIGHYLVFIALLEYSSTNSIITIDDNDIDNFFDLMNEYGDMNFSKKLLDEAYQNYVRDSRDGNLTFDEWRGTISAYAISKDESGNYQYGETIAEAFHDVYLNSGQAKPASKYIVNVLKKYLEG